MEEGGPAGGGGAGRQLAQHGEATSSTYGEEEARRAKSSTYGEDGHGEHGQHFAWEK